jgi:hypothetical protein
LYTLVDFAVIAGGKENSERGGEGRGEMGRRKKKREKKERIRIIYCFNATLC